VHSHGTCEGPVAGETCYAESTDAGATWRLIKAFPNLGYEAVGSAIINANTWLTFEPFSGIYLTQNAGQTWTHAYKGPAAEQTGGLYKHGDGNYYAASFDGVLKSADGIKWTLIPDSPRSFTIAGDGTTVWVSMWDEDPEVAYWTSTGNLTSWKAYASPKMKIGSWYMRYDRDHNLLYTSNMQGGLWRVKTK
jgi:hypothetical protein